MLPNVKRILYSTDLSANANYALGYAVYLAKSVGAEVHVINIVERMSREAKMTLRTYLMDDKKRKALTEERFNSAKEKLEHDVHQFVESLEESEREIARQVISTIKIVESYPAEEILKKSQELECDLIVMGAHDRGMVHTFLGSVTKSVLRRSSIPTLVVPVPEGVELPDYD